MVMVNMEDMDMEDMEDMEMEDMESMEGAATEREDMENMEGAATELEEMENMEAGAATEWEDGEGDVEKLKCFLELIENKYFILNFELL
ncbi:unnamed protein product [Meloidogyne enterolobii]|uniref:Uncharacterized protein n=1 Tax=Meloidogyne enterolobii TaxID=390850 RepID=A0ACB0YHN2_MELEN